MKLRCWITMVIIIFIKYESNLINDYIYRTPDGRSNRQCQNYIHLPSMGYNKADFLKRWIKNSTYGCISDSGGGSWLSVFSTGVSSETEGALQILATIQKSYINHSSCILHIYIHVLAGVETIMKLLTSLILILQLYWDKKDKCFVSRTSTNLLFSGSNFLKQRLAGDRKCIH